MQTSDLTNEQINAVREPYRCPVCGVADPNAYLRCHRPDCTDGRDIGTRRAAGVR